MTGYGKFILSLPADVPSLRNFFPCYTHAIGNRDVLVMLEYRWVKRYLVAHHGYHAHAFRPGADDYVRVAQADAVRGQRHGLQAGGTKAIDGHPRHAIRQPRQQERNARDIHALFRLRHGAARNHVVDCRRIKPRALMHCCFQYMCQHVVGAHGFEHASRRLANRGSHGSNDIGILNFIGSHRNLLGNPLSV